LKKQLEENEKQMKLMKQSYEEKLAEAKAQVKFLFLSIFSILLINKRSSHINF
jgi:hypothetical protein